MSSEILGLCTASFSSFADMSAMVAHYCSFRLSRPAAYKSKVCLKCHSRAIPAYSFFKVLKNKYSAVQS